MGVWINFIRVHLDDVSDQITHFLFHVDSAHAISVSQPRVKPPSTINVCPVRYEDLSLKRKVTSLATSSGLPNRPIGMRRVISSLRWPLILRSISVSIYPGAMAFTVML